MLSKPSAADLPVLFLLHFLGGSADSWQDVIPRLAERARCVPIDLPGFGEAADIPGYAVSQMADHVAAAIRQTAASRFLMAGHSMGAKIAMVLARRAEDSEAGLAGLAGLILIAGSPPGPEPMGDDKRSDMLSWFNGGPAQSHAEARGFIRSAVAAPLHQARESAAAGTVLRAHINAWRAWLQHGSREDWSEQVGILQTPTLIIAGAEDADLGIEAQAALRQRHFARASLVTIPDAAHLLPIETPGEIARLIADHIAATISGIDPAYLALIASDRVSRETRAALLERAFPDDPGYQPRALDPREFAVLRAVLDHVLPQPHAPRIDLAARIDTMLADGKGDGWRFAVLPPDAQTYSAGLRSIDAACDQGFCTLDRTAQDAILHRVADGGPIAAGPTPLGADQMKKWFEDVRADAVRLYVGHPATLARIGYSGIAYGGDGEPKPGFRLLGLDQRDTWEPQAAS